MFPAAIVASTTGSAGLVVMFNSSGRRFNYAAYAASEAHARSPRGVSHAS